MKNKEFIFFKCFSPSHMETNANNNHIISGMVENSSDDDGAENHLWTMGVNDITGSLSLEPVELFELSDSPPPRSFCTIL